MEKLLIQPDCITSPATSWMDGDSDSILKVLRKECVCGGGVSISTIYLSTYLFKGMASCSQGWSQDLYVAEDDPEILIFLPPLVTYGIIRAHYHIPGLCVAGD